MKYFKYILVALFVILIIYIIASPKQNSSVSQGTPSDGTHELCYIWSTEAGDKALLHINLASDTTLTGSFDFVPAEKDSKKGPFSGTLSAPDANGTQIANLAWQASAEGMTNTEELRIQINGSIAKPGFGEMKDRGDGTYVYASPDKISYDLSLQQTDCSDL